MYEQERQAQLDEHNLQQQREDARRAIIEEERQRLLQEHSVKLYGYLPKELERYCPLSIFHPPFFIFFLFNFIFLIFFNC
jgi:hypothetical protein